MTNLNMTEQERAEPRPDIVTKFNERFKLPEFELPEELRYGGEPIITLKRFSLAVQHPLGTLTGGVGIGADLRPFLNPLEYRREGYGRGGSGGLGVTAGRNKAPLFTPLGSVETRAILEGAEEDTDQRIIILKAPLVIFMDLVGILNTTHMVGKVWNETYRSFVYAGEIFTNDKGAAITESQSTGINGWSMVYDLGHGRYSSNGLLHLPYNPVIFQQLELSVGNVIAPKNS